MEAGECSNVSWEERVHSACHSTFINLRIKVYLYEFQLTLLFVRGIDDDDG